MHPTSLVYPVIIRELCVIQDSQCMENFVRWKDVVTVEKAEKVISVVCLVTHSQSYLSTTTSSNRLSNTLHGEAFFSCRRWTLFLHSQVSYLFNGTETSRGILYGEIFFHQINILREKERCTVRRSAELRAA